MAVRPIDAVHVLNDINWHHKPTPVSEFESGFNQGLNQAMWIITHAPTLTPPNEWVSVETPPTEQGWYHVAILDLKTGKYNVEQDLYSIELAKEHGFEPGFCKANRWEERERIDYWCRFPSPPESRPPEGEEDT